MGKMVMKDSYSHPYQFIYVLDAHNRHKALTMANPRAQIVKKFKTQKTVAKESKRYISFARPKSAKPTYEASTGAEHVPIPVHRHIERHIDD